MKVVSVKIQNILGIEDFEVLPKEINRFEGKNSTGKTSTLEAIKAALKGGHDATLLRQGADEGQVVILLDDGMEIKKTVTAAKTDLSVKYPRSGVKVDKPQTQINALVDALSINPVEFLTAPAKDRANYLLQAMPLKVTKEDLMGIWDQPIPTGHAFEILAAIEKAIFDDRTGVNRLHDEKVKTAKQLGETLPLEDPKNPEPDWSKTVRETTQALAEAKTSLKNARTQTDRDHQDQNQLIVARCASRLADTNTEYRKKLDELNRWKRGLDEAAQADEKRELAEEANRYAAALKDAEGNLAQQISSLSADLATAETKIERQIKDNATRETIARVLSEAEAHESESKSLTNKLEALKGLRFKILANLPIPGLSVQDGQVLRDGIPYDRLNTAQQIEIAVAIAKLRAKELGIVCVDGLECLDEENFQAFEKAMTGSGLQCFITRVTNTPMEVTVK